MCLKIVCTLEDLVMKADNSLTTKSVSQLSVWLTSTVMTTPADLDSFAE